MNRRRFFNRKRPRQNQEDRNQDTASNNVAVEVHAITQGDPIKAEDVRFYESFHEAYADIDKVEAKKRDIIIRSEGSMDDPKLRDKGRVFAGNAWWIIFQRRIEDGFYPQGTVSKPPNSKLDS